MIGADYLYFDNGIIWVFNPISLSSSEMIRLIMWV